MDVVGLYLASAILFFSLDFIGLRYLVGPVFKRHVGPLLADRVRIGPALTFYAFYIAGLVYLVSWPALESADPWRAALNGAVLGALAYGTYEFTNLATLKGWTWSMVAVDLIWGTILTAVSSGGAVLIMLSFT